MEKRKNCSIGHCGKAEKLLLRSSISSFPQCPNDQFLLISTIFSMYLTFAISNSDNSDYCSNQTRLYNVLYISTPVISNYCSLKTENYGPLEFEIMRVHCTSCRYHELLSG